MLLLHHIHGWVAGVTGPGGKPDAPLPSDTLQLLLWDPNAFPGKKGIHNISSEF